MTKRTVFSRINNASRKDVILYRKYLEKYSSGRRGAPAKGIGRVTGARVQIPPSPFEVLNFEKNKIYCIDKETYSLSSRSGSVISNYSLLMLNNNVITNVNPSGRPFVMIANALYCFMRKMEKEKETLLLLDRHEFELIRDFNDLNNVELVI